MGGNDVLQVLKGANPANVSASFGQNLGMILGYVSDRDGYRCLWAQRLDPDSRRPQGDPTAIRHFHTAAQLMQRNGLDPLQISVARDRILFNMRETSGNVWMLRPAESR